MNSWEKILQHMERRVNPHSFATWFMPTKQEGGDNGTVVVRVPSRPFRKRLPDLIRSSILARQAPANIGYSAGCVRMAIWMI